MATTLSVEDRITKQRAHIMRDMRFIAMAGIMMVGKWSVDDKVPTACTNGRDVIYGRAFMAGLNDKQIRFVILHEYYHIMFMHLSMWKHLFKQHAMCANFATDMVINNMLDNLAGSKADNFIEFVPSGILDHSYDGLDTGEVFRRLMQQAQKQQGGSGQGPKVPGAGGKDGQPLDEHDIDGESGMAGGPLSEEEVKELHQQIDTAIRQGAQMAGKVGGNVDRSITDLLEVQVDWREVLQDFVKSYCAGNDLSTWRKPSRRYLARDIYQPTRYSESTKRITIGVDTSGSIGEEQLRRALTEIKGACDSVHPEIVDIIYWDSEVAAHEVYEADSVDTIVNATKPAGGGGTRVGSMLNYMNAKGIRPDCVIIFTDGYVESDWGGNNWPAPVMWCISVKGITAPFGKSLYVPVE
jgi:predicted metal-dependent peptidase